MPRYLTDDCQLVSSNCVVSRTQTGLGDRAFQVAGPKLWNSLPAEKSLVCLRLQHVTDF